MFIMEYLLKLAIIMILLHIGQLQLMRFNYLHFLFTIIHHLLEPTSYAVWLMIPNII